MVMDHVERDFTAIDRAMIRKREEEMLRAQEGNVAQIRRA